MDAKYIKAHDHITNAREALRRGDKQSARELGEQAALLIPEMEDAWLILAASDPDPQDALAYARKALELNPESARAHKAVEWAAGRAKQAPAESEPKAVAEMNLRSEVVPAEEKVQLNAVTAFPRVIPRNAEPETQPESKPKDRRWVFAAVLGVLLCAVIGAGIWMAFTSPMVASLLNGSSATTREDHWASVDVPKPSVTSIDVSVFAPPQVAETPTPQPTQKPPTAAATDEPAIADTPTAIFTDAPTSIPEVTETPGAMAMEIVADTPTSQFAQPNPDAPKPSVASNGSTRWIDVDLTNQRVYAYEGETLVNSFLVSTGTWLTPTVTGQYKVYVKYEKANMHGPGYFLPDVPYVMYFYKGYGLHGTYWHSNFGTPMSHGCVNLATGDAGWLFSWASVGTVVNVHY